MRETDHSLELNTHIVPRRNNLMRCVFLFVGSRADVHISLLKNKPALHLLLLLQMLVEWVSFKQMRIEYFLLILRIHVEKWCKQNIHLWLMNQKDRRKLSLRSNIEGLINILRMIECRWIFSVFGHNRLCGHWFNINPYNNIKLR